MHIVNVMFSKGLGGIEQALVDYCEALKMEGHKVTAIISPRAKIKSSLLPLGVNIIEVKNFAAWDFLAKAYIRKVFKQLNPDAVIAHGNRAVSLLKGQKAGGRVIPLIGVTHNYSIKRQIGLDAILATTNDLKRAVIAAGQAEDKVFKLPNMVRARTQSVESKSAQSSDSSLEPKPGTKTLVIGTMGRFVKKKGFDVFIRAIAHLKEQGVDFNAVIGGGGEEEANLKQLAAQLGMKENSLGIKENRHSPSFCEVKTIGESSLNESEIPNNYSGSNDLHTQSLNFIGWVNNKQQFFDNIDIFVLPSLHEPFGIILLEAFAHGKPVVTSDSEGPSEISEDNIDAIIVKKGDSQALAEGIMKLVNNPELADKIAQNGFAKAAKYDIKHFAASLNEALKRIVT